MPSSAQTLITGAVGLHYEALSNRQLLLCLVGYYSSVAGLTATTCLNGAISAGYEALSEWELKQCILDVLS